MLRAPLVFLSQRKTFKQLIMGVSLTRRLAMRFVAGDTLAEAMMVVRALNAGGARATLDHLGENVVNLHDARRAAAAYVTALNGIAAEGVDSNVSLKLSHMGLDISRDLCLDNLNAVLRTARERNNFVRIDMESSSYVGRTLSIYEDLRARGFANVGVAIQSYLYRSEADVKKMVALGTRVRLIKGAYDEPASVAFPKKRDVDANFRRLAAMLLERGNYPAIATHDKRIIDWTKRHADEHGIGRERFEFQLLYGIRRDLQQQLVAEGYNVRVYVPYGNEWYAYLMRRLAERPANLFFILTNLFRG